jgi:hypothetical protein
MQLHADAAWSLQMNIGCRKLVREQYRTVDDIGNSSGASGAEVR